MEATVLADKDFRIVAADVDDARKRLRSYLQSREFWVVIFDFTGMPIFEEITRRYYLDSRDEDMFGVLVPVAGGFLGVGVFRRSLMLAPKFKFLLDKHGVALSTKEIVEAGAIYRALTGNLGHVERLAKSLKLKHQGSGLAIEE